MCRGQLTPQVEDKDAAEIGRRQRAAVVARHGEDVYRHGEAKLRWQAFQLLGKLRSIVYLLQRQR